MADFVVFVTGGPGFTGLNDGRDGLGLIGLEDDRDEWRD